MTLTLAAWIFFWLHILVSIVVTVLILLRRLTVRWVLIPFVWLMPICGVFCVLVIHFREFILKAEMKEVGIEKLAVENEVYKSVQIESEESRDVVSLEEALTINTPELRRSMILDILNNHPEEYLALLNQARLNEDVEVVHYATTALVELSKTYDEELQRLDQEWSRDPENEEVLDRYCFLLGQYIGEGLVKGQMELVQREQYSRILQKSLELNPQISKFTALVENQLRLKEYAQAERALSEMKKLWPAHQEYWLLLIEFYARQKRGKEIQEAIRQMEAENIFISAKNKDMIAFWKKDAIAFCKERQEGGV